MSTTPSTTTTSAAAAPSSSPPSATLLELRTIVQKQRLLVTSKETLLHDKTIQSDAAKKSDSVILRSLGDALIENQKIRATLETTEREVSAVRPQYEQVIRNTPSIELIQKVAEAEAKLNAAKKQLNESDVRLQGISNRYTQEYDAQELFVTNLATKISTLENSLKAKISLSGTGPDWAHPNESMSAIETLTKERELEASNLTRQVRELEYIVQAKDTRRTHLDTEGNAQVQEVAVQKDEEIRKMILQIHQERDMILNDIQDVRVVNREQAFNLRRGQVQKEKTNSGIQFAPAKGSKLRTPTRADATATPPIRATTRQAQFRSESKPTEGEMVLSKANQTLEEERVELTTRLHRTTSDKNDLQKSIKGAQENAKKETEQRRQLLRELEMEALASKRKASQLEDENLKLEENCQMLASTLKTTRNQYAQLTESSQQRTLTAIEA